MITFSKVDLFLNRHISESKVFENCKTSRNKLSILVYNLLSLHKSTFFIKKILLKTIEKCFCNTNNFFTDNKS